MKRKVILTASIVITLMSILIVTNCSSSKKAVDGNTPELVVTNENVAGQSFELEFIHGASHNHPLMVFWIEDMDGNYIQTLYVAKSIAKGVFEHGDPSEGKWKAGAIRRPAALPYWAHKRGVQAEDGLYIPSQKNPMPDAVTAATPLADFLIRTRADLNGLKKFKVLFEINQTWDWNEYWTNNKYPDDEEYKTSCQPSLIYQAVVDLDTDIEEYILNPIGHGHYSGKNGELFSDLSTMTTALSIVKVVKFRIN